VDDYEFEVDNNCVNDFNFRRITQCCHLFGFPTNSLQGAWVFVETCVFQEHHEMMKPVPTR
jgi:hypothetical protein